MRSSKGLFCFILFVFLSVFLAPVSASAAWPENGVPVCQAFPYQIEPRMAPDGAGGAIVAWRDNRGEFGIFVQRVNASGNVLWESGGIDLGLEISDYTTYFELIPDGVGGALAHFFYYDYGQDANIGTVARVDGGGVLRWADVLTSGSLSDYAVVGESGNAFIVASYRDSIRVKKVDANGVEQWTKSWIVPAVHVWAIQDGSGGIIVHWQEDYDSDFIHAQRLTAGGDEVWDGDVGWDDISDNGGSRVMAPDGTGGFIGLFTVPLYENWSITMACRIDASGASVWGDTLGVVFVCPYAGRMEILGDGSNGVIFSIESKGSGFLQKLDTLGNSLWTSDGVRIFGNADHSDDPLHARIATDGAGGAIAVWHETNFEDPHLQYDIRMQRIGANGAVLWDSSGVIAIDAMRDQLNPAIISDGEGGAIIAWEDGRDMLPHIYAMRFNPSGEEHVAGFFVPQFVLGGVSNYPNPFNPSVTVAYSLNGMARVALDIYDVSGKRIANLRDAVEDAGAHTVVWNGTDANGNRAGSGVYFCRIRAGSEIISRKMVLLR